MGKKKRKKGSRGNDYAGFAPGPWGDYPYYGGYGQNDHQAEYGHKGHKGGYAGLFDSKILKNLPGMGSRQTEQFLLGALIGAAATYVLSDEEMRGKLVKMGIKLFSGVVGSFEEMKEQMADLKAEVEAERHGDA